MGGSARTYVMVGVAVVAAVAAPYLAPFIAEGLGTLLISAEALGVGIEGAIAAIEVANAVAPALAGAATGAVAGGANAELGGRDPWEGAFQGAAAGGVGGAVSGAVGAALPSGTNPAVAAGVRGAASGFTSAQLKGQDLEESLTASAISGGTAGLTSALMPSGFLGGGQTAEDYVTDEEGMFVYDNKGNPVLTEDAQTAAKLSDIAEKTARGFGGAYIRQNLSSLFDPQPTTGQGSTTASTTRTPPSGGTTTGGTTPSVRYTPSGQTYQASGTYAPSSPTETTASPGSQALAQALRVGDPGSAIESPAGSGEQQTVWNTASLRFKDETGSDV
jgi:hypothetical protein